MRSFGSSCGVGGRSRIACSSAQTGSTLTASFLGGGLAPHVREPSDAKRSAVGPGKIYTWLNYRDDPNEPVGHFRTNGLWHGPCSFAVRGMSHGAAVSVRESVHLFVRRARMRPMRAGLL